MAQVAIDEATGTDRGDLIVAAMVACLRARGILLPTAVTLERLGLAARAKARRRAYRYLAEGLDEATLGRLDALITIPKDEDRTPLAWLREGSEAPTQKNLVGLVERLRAFRDLGIGADREQRIHRARYAAIAREAALLSAQHLTRFDEHRRRATLVVLARELEASLTDSALTVFDKLIGGVFRRAKREHQAENAQRAKTLDLPVRALLGMTKLLLAARDAGEDPIAAVEKVMGWDRVEQLVKDLDHTLTPERPDPLRAVMDRNLTVHRLAPVVLDAFVFRSWKAGDPLLAALDVLRQAYASGRKKLRGRIPTAFLTPARRRRVGAGPTLDRRAYEIATLTCVRHRAEILKKAPHLIAHVGAHGDELGACAQDRTDPMMVEGFHLHLPIPAGADDLGQPEGIVAVALVHLQGQGGFRMPGVQADDGKPQGGQLMPEPGGQRPRLQTNFESGGGFLPKLRGKVSRCRRTLALPKLVPQAIDNAEMGGFLRDIQANEDVHVFSP